MHAAVTLTRRTESTLREEHPRRDSAGVMTDSVVRVSKASGGTRLLQCHASHGDQADITDVHAWVRGVRRYNLSAG